MGVSMQDIKKLREKTGAGVLDCKKALSEKDGDVEAAVEYLREKGIAEAAKKSGRVAAEGMVNVRVNDAHNKGLIVELNSETDFVAKNDKFKNLIEDISNHIMASDKDNLDSLLDEKWFDDKTKDVNTIVKEAVANIGENINLRRFKKYNTDGFLQGYIHMNGKIGVIAEFTGEATDENLKIANNVAMHIAAKDPEYLSRDFVSDKAIKKEKKIYKEQMLNEGKPEHIIDNIVEGKINKYFTQVCLVEQEYVKDTDINVGELLDDAGIEIKSFVRYELGEGIETEEEDFASEVMAEVEKN